MEELNRCKKCGGKASVYSEPTHNHHFVGYYTSCDNCDLTVGNIDDGTYSLTKEEAINKWNAAA